MYVIGASRRSPRMSPPEHSVVSHAERRRTIQPASQQQAQHNDASLTAGRQQASVPAHAADAPVSCNHKEEYLNIVLCQPSVDERAFSA